jgi:hypothetical protein
MLIRIIPKWERLPKPEWLYPVAKSKLKRDVKEHWKIYKKLSEDCHLIARRVMNRKKWVGQSHTEFAFPEEIKEYDEKARDLKKIETLIALLQKELNRRNPQIIRENYKFNQDQVKSLTHELINHN